MMKMLDKLHKGDTFFLHLQHFSQSINPPAPTETKSKTKIASNSSAISLKAKQKY
jgi:hypothetical protein